MERIGIRLMYMVAGLLGPAAVYAFLPPLYKNPQMYGQIEQHARAVLPGLNGKLAAQRQQFFMWAREQLPKAMYPEFVSMYETLRSIADQAQEMYVALQYVPLIRTYEKKIQELSTIIAQMQAQQPLYVGSAVPEVSTIVMPEGASGQKLTQPGPVTQAVPQEPEPEEGVVATQQEEEQEEESESENIQQKKPVVTVSQLEEMPRARAALVKTEIDQLKRELQEGMQKEQEGTAQPGWRDYIMQKWTQLKEWTTNVISGESQEEPENEEGL